MKIKSRFVVPALAVLALSDPRISLHAQGSLTPPGAPAPTMKTLDQVEARTIVNSTTCPGGNGAAFIISQPGSYYLGANITVAGGSGINIAANGVTLDLNGFTISSTSFSTSNSGDAIYSNATQDTTIRNGHLRGTTSYGAGNNGSPGTFSGAGFANGINIAQGRNCKVENVTVYGVRGFGISLLVTEATVSRCSVDIAESTGIFAQPKASVVDHCTAQACGINGIQAQIVDGCSANAVGSGSYGIYASAVTNAVAYGYYTGIYSLNNAAHCTGNAYSSPGISATTLTDCNASSTNGDGIVGTTANDCVGYSVSARGIFVDNTTDCYGYTNTGGTAAGLESSRSVNSYGISYDLSNSATGLKATNATNCRGEAFAGIGLNATTATGCTGVSVNGTGLSAKTSQNSAGTSSGGLGLYSEDAINDYGVSSSSEGLNAQMATNCTGASTSSVGLRAQNATTCTGSSDSNIGLFATMAMNCTGSTKGTNATAIGLNCLGAATSCVGYASSGAFSIKSTVSVSCFGQGGTASFGTKFNMP